MNETKQIHPLKKIEQEIGRLKPAEIVDNDIVRTNFIQMASRIQSANNPEQIFEIEKFYFLKTIAENKELQQCTPLSLYGCFIELAVQGLSLDPNRRLAYLTYRNFNVGTKDNKIWERRAVINISAYGELYLRQKYGQIKYADNPVFILEGDEFHVVSTQKGKEIYHKFTLPRNYEKPLACYIRIVKPDGSADVSILDLQGMRRLQKYSEENNKGKANELYTSNNGLPDLKFWEAKTIKFAFRSYPKMPYGASIISDDEYVPPAQIEMAQQEETPQQPEMTTNNQADEEIF